MQELQKEQGQKSFDPHAHLIPIKVKEGVNKDYLPVQWRLVWFRLTCPEGTIETEMLHLDLDRDTEEEVWVWNPDRRRNEKVMKHAKGFVIFHAIAKDGKGSVGSGTKSEKAASFDDFIEKAETGAIGRALAALGYGTQFTGDEWDEAHRIVDSPVDGKEPPAPSELAKRAAEEMAQLRARVEEIKPQNNKGVMNLEQFYAITFKKKWPGDHNVSVDERKRMNDQLDEIVWMRKKPPEVQAAS